MSSIYTIGVLSQFIVAIVCLFGTFTMYRMIHILFQVEKDRVYKVEVALKHIDGIWVALDTMGVSNKFKEMVLRDIENDLNQMFGSSSNSENKDNSPGVSKAKDIPKKSALVG